MENSTTADRYLEPRSDTDRRTFSWRTVVFGFVRSRRRGFRRRADGEAVFTDSHPPRVGMLAVGVMLMSSLDAFFTLQLIERGAQEINPFMAATMGAGTLTFAATKMALTGFSVLMLVYLARAQIFNRLRTGMMLSLAFAMYACLICYEIVLLV